MPVRIDHPSDTRHTSGRRRRCRRCQAPWRAVRAMRGRCGRVPTRRAHEHRRCVPMIRAPRDPEQRFPQMSLPQGYRPSSSGVLMLRNAAWSTWTSCDRRRAITACSARSPSSKHRRICSMAPSRQIAHVGSIDDVRATTTSTPGRSPAVATIAWSASPVSAGRSHATMKTPSGRGSRVSKSSSTPSTPPSGPDPGYRSACTGSPTGASSSGSPPKARTSRHPAALNAAATRAAMGTPSISINALVVPMRRLAPPVSTAPTNHGANDGPGNGD